MSKNEIFKQFIKVVEDKILIQLDENDTQIFQSAIEQVYGPKGWKSFMKIRMQQIKNNENNENKKSGAEKMKIISQEWKLITPLVKKNTWGASVTKNKNINKNKKTATWNIFYTENNNILKNNITAGAERKIIIATMWKALGKEGKHKYYEEHGDGGQSPP
jgi:hypothetical protein